MEVKVQTCKECLYYEACSYHITEETGMTIVECSIGFKNKDEYVKLPVYIGQEVFKLRNRYKYDGTTFNLVGFEIQEGKVSMIQQKADKSWKFRVTIQGSVCDYTLTEIGKNIFLSKLEAQEEYDRRMLDLNKTYPRLQLG